MSNTNNKLPASFENDLDELKMKHTRNLTMNTDWEIGYEKGIQDGIEIGATEYAIQLHHVEQMEANLKRALFRWKEYAGTLKSWKAEAKLLLAPIIDYGKGHIKDIKLGASCTTFVLDRAKAYDELKERAERYEKALKENEMQHADLTIALAAMLNGYQNLSAYQKQWFRVPKDLIDEYTRMVLEYDALVGNDKEVDNG